jgi:hypothetical protein
MNDLWGQTEPAPSWDDLTGILPKGVWPTRGFLENKGHLLSILVFDPGHELTKAQLKVIRAIQSHEFTCLVIWGSNPGQRERLHAYDWTGDREIGDLRLFVDTWWKGAELWPR